MNRSPTPFHTALTSPTALRRPLAALVLLGASANVACVSTLPPPPAPPKAAPHLEDDLPEAKRGEGVVVLDAHGERARVEIVEGMVQTHGYVRGHHVTSVGVATRSLCNSTPCAAVLPQGEQRLIFQGVDDAGRASAAVVKVGKEPVAVQHTMGQSRSPGPVGTAGFVLSLLGAGALGTGALLLAVAPKEDATSGLRGTAQNVAIAGGLGLGAGLTMFFVDRPTRQEGSTVQFRFAPTAAPQATPATLARN